MIDMYVVIETASIWYQPSNFHSVLREKRTGLRVDDLRVFGAFDSRREAEKQRKKKEKHYDDNKHKSYYLKTYIVRKIRVV